MHDLFIATVFIAMVAGPCVVAMFNKDQENEA